MTALLNIENIRARTAESRMLNALPVPEPLEAEQQKLQDIANAANAELFGCNRPAVRALVETMLGISLPEPTPNPVRPPFKFVIGSIVFDKKRLYLILSVDEDGDARFIRDNLMMSTPGGDSYISSTRVVETATDEQVEEFLMEVGLLERPVVPTEEEVSEQIADGLV